MTKRTMTKVDLEEIGTEITMCETFEQLLKILECSRDSREGEIAWIMWNAFVGDV